MAAPSSDVNGKVKAEGHRVRRKTVAQVPGPSVCVMMGKEKSMCGWAHRSTASEDQELRAKGTSPRTAPVSRTGGDGQKVFGLKSGCESVLQGGQRAGWSGWKRECGRIQRVLGQSHR